MTQAQSEKLHELFVQHSRRMVEIAYRHVGDEELARDLVQEVFVLAVAKADIVCSHPQPLGWLFKALRHMSMHEMARSYHTQEVPIEDVKGLSDAAGISASLSMEAFLPDGLTDEERELILFRVRDKLSYSEIAEMKGMREDACRKRGARAIRKCRMLLEQDAAADVL